MSLGNIEKEEVISCTRPLVCRNFGLVRCHLTLKNGSFFFRFSISTLEATLSTPIGTFSWGVGHPLWLVLSLEVVLEIWMKSNAFGFVIEVPTHFRILLACHTHELDLQWADIELFFNQTSIPTSKHVLKTYKTWRCCMKNSNPWYKLTSSSSPPIIKFLLWNFCAESSRSCSSSPWRTEVLCCEELFRLTIAASLMLLGELVDTPSKVPWINFFKNKIKFKLILIYTSICPSDNIRVAISGLLFTCDHDHSSGTYESWICYQKLYVHKIQILPPSMHHKWKEISGIHRITKNGKS